MIYLSKTDQRGKKKTNIFLRAAMCLDATLGALQIFNFHSNKKEKGHILEGRGVVFLAFTNSLVDYIQ